ncbi:hypothetical protein Cabther_B0420 [Chloracidobacterium thermophilum B]|uniref:Uncharacterized protein n=1 Tax=Chloracidobacterium thermophilum (strain B) TaxID=981222 RepID=G2LLE6_CHLTF|nr:hypothetical protein Cabther_B0420 [Chloracidobacterium thermophilum B]
MNLRLLFQNFKSLDVTICQAQ